MSTSATETARKHIEHWKQEYEHANLIANVAQDQMVSLFERDGIDPDVYEIRANARDKAFAERARITGTLDAVTALGAEIAFGATPEWE